MSVGPVIVLFTNDLRLSDNAAVTAAVSSGKPVLPLYILDGPASAARAPGGASRWWLERSLGALSSSLERLGGRLVLRRGATLDVLKALVDETGAEAIHFSRGYTASADRLQRGIAAWCENTGVSCRRFGGFLLYEPEQVRTGSGNPYRVFTPFSRACFADAPDKTPLPVPNAVEFWQGYLASDDLVDWALYAGKPDWACGFSRRWEPGESGAKDKLERFVDGPMVDYKDGRDIPGVHGTSRLSAHLHFGEVSPRQCWWAALMASGTGPLEAGPGVTTFLKELLWREFSYHLLASFPELDSKPFNPRFERFEWRQDAQALQAWQKGQTGYPIVDAGMRELWQTGWMHNRVRMIVASFLVKHLLIHWREGESWFWDCLVDADPGSNPAGWQWVAGSGADAAPYFRVFNPVLQGERFDPDGAYVRRWVPELAKLDRNFLHKPWTAPDAVLERAGVVLGKSYREPIVDHAMARSRALEAYASTG